jgi:hypothetical protein
MTVEQAQAILARIPEYAWLTSGNEQWYSPGEVAAAMGINAATVRLWCDRGDVVGAINYGGRMGWKLPRSGLLLYFAALAERS